MPPDDDRRESSSRVEFSDGNGGTTVVYSFSVKRVNAIAGLIVSLIIIGGVVFGAVRFGVETAVHKEFEHQLAEPRSDLNRHIDAKFTASCTIAHSGTLVRLRAVENQLAVVQDQNVRQAEEMQELRHDIRELLRRTE